MADDRTDTSGHGSFRMLHTRGPVGVVSWIIEALQTRITAITGSDCSNSCPDYTPPLGRPECTTDVISQGKSVISDRTKPCGKEFQWHR